MKKLLYCLPLLTLGGCAVVKDAFTRVEAFVKSPPQAVVTAVHLVTDFLLGLLNVLLHGVFTNTFGGLFS
jgi:hypothetical protein